MYITSLGWDGSYFTVDSVTQKMFPVGSPFCPKDTVKAPKALVCKCNKEFELVSKQGQSTSKLFKADASCYFCSE
jgi:hypothetical protein